MKSPIHHVESAGTGMIFVEGFRLLFVLAGSVAGFEIGRSVDAGQHAPVVGLLLGAAVSYVLGGVAGRLVDRGLQQAVFLFRNTPPGETFAASIVATTGMLLGLVIGLPLLVLFRSGFALLITAVIAWVLATLGWRLGSVKGRQIVAAAGLSRILAPQPGPPEGHALLADSSAMMDRFLLVLGPRGPAAGRTGHPPIRHRPHPVGGRLPRSGHLPSGPAGPRVGRGAQGDGGSRAHRSGRDSRSGRPDHQAAHRGPPARAADRNLFHGRRGRGRQMGVAGGRPARHGQRSDPRPSSGRTASARSDQRGTPVPPGGRLSARRRHGGGQRRDPPGGPGTGGRHRALHPSHQPGPDGLRQARPTAGPRPMESSATRPDRGDLGLAVRSMPP